MQKIITTLLFCLLYGVVTTAAQKNYCFENDGLKVKQKISFVLIGSKVEGVMESGGYETENMETFDFTGTKTGNLLTVKFDGGKSPYEVAPRTKRIVWTLGGLALKVTMYGKNYDTGKYSVYTASFDKCEEN